MSDKLAKVDTFSALTPHEEADALFSNEELGDSMGTKGFGPGDMEKVTVPGAGGTTWEVGEEAVKHLDVVIIAAQDTRKYYVKPYDGSKNPPDCVSLDGVHGIAGDDAPEECGGLCEDCPLAQWGSARDKDGNPLKGKACSERKAMLILREKSALPLILSAPPSSLKYVQPYFGRMVSGRGRPFYGVVTRLSLEKDKSETGIVYSAIKPTFVRDLERDEVLAVRKLRDTFVPALAARVPEIVENE